MNYLFLSTGFEEIEALTTVDKNAFAKTNAKVVAVGGSFSKDVAKQLEKAGAKSVKNKYLSFIIGL